MLPATLTEPAAAIAERLLARGQSVAVAESSAGGLISAALLSVAGASAYYRGGAVIYTRESTRALLGGAVTDLDPGTKGASEPFARYLAAAARATLAADWGVSETGATGPSGNPYGDPAGHAWVGLAGPDGALAATHVLTGDDDRATNMEAFAAAALTRFLTALG